MQARSQLQYNWWCHQVLPPVVSTVSFLYVEMDANPDVGYSVEWLLGNFVGLLEGLMKKDGCSLATLYMNEI